MEKEICICAAIRFRNKAGKELLIRGHRHGDCFLNLDRRPDRDSYLENYEGIEQGFITSKNRFVDRIEGRKLQDKAGVKSADPEGYRRNTLFSEDLY